MEVLIFVGLLYELASCHPSGAKDFEGLHGFLRKSVHQKGNLYTKAVHCMHKFEISRSWSSLRAFEFGVGCWTGSPRTLNGDGRVYRYGGCRRASHKQFNMHIHK